MNTRFATLAAAVALSLAAPAAFAQPVVRHHAPAVSVYDDITTGSIVAAPQVRAADRWEGVSSAKAGNANQQNFPVPQYGQTAGGPAY